jgi:serine/threonine protein kinase
MGEVWQATDTKLGRDVALKILPDAFANDADRMARFEREAKVLASLNHPNIAAIYGVEDRALVLELVEGIGVKITPVSEAFCARHSAGAIGKRHTSHKRTSGPCHPNPSFVRVARYPTVMGSR